MGLHIHKASSSCQALPLLGQDCQSALSGAEQSGWRGHATLLANAHFLGIPAMQPASV